MSRNRKLIVGIVGIAIAFVVVGLGPLVGPGLIVGIRVEHAKVRLLRDTDHQVLLEACRELSRRQANGELNTPEPLETSPLLPEVIRALRPDLVTVRRDGLVNIEVGDKWYFLGVWAFPEGYQKPSVGYGDRKLLEGLWYYEDGYNLDPEAYDEEINKLLRKNEKIGKTSLAPDIPS